MSQGQGRNQGRGGGDGENHRWASSRERNSSSYNEREHPRDFGYNRSEDGYRDRNGGDGMDGWSSRREYDGNYGGMNRGRDEEGRFPPDRGGRDNFGGERYGNRDWSEGRYGGRRTPENEGRYGSSDSDQSGEYDDGERWSSNSRQPWQYEDEDFDDGARERYERERFTSSRGDGGFGGDRGRYDGDRGGSNGSGRDNGWGRGDNYGRNDGWQQGSSRGRGGNWSNNRDYRDRDERGRYR